MKSEENIIQEDSPPSPPSKVGLTTGVRLGLSGLVDTEDLIQRALGTSERFDGKEYPEDSPPATGEFITFSFKGTKTGDLEVSIQTGEVELGPATVLKADGTCWINGTQVATGRFTDSLTSGLWSATPTAGSAIWFVWAEVDVREDDAGSVFPKWRLMEGATIPPLYVGSDPSEEFNLKWTRQKKILQIAIVADKITTVKNLQCGNIDIPRL